MSASRQALFLASLAMFGAACTESTAPLGARATVVVPDTLVTTRVATPTSQWIEFKLPVSIRNTASVPVTFLVCNSGIEAQNSGVWAGVWAPYCFATADSQTPIAPGETRVVSMTVTAGVGGNAGPVWGNATVNGTYRLTAALMPDGFAGTVPTISSNTFTLLQGQ